MNAQHTLGPRVRPDYILHTGRTVRHVAENGHQRAIVTPGLGDFTIAEWEEYVAWRPWAAITKATGAAA